MYKRQVPAASAAGHDGLLAGVAGLVGRGEALARGDHAHPAVGAEDRSEVVFTGRIEVKPGSGEEGVDDGLFTGVLRLGFVGEPTEDVVVEDDRPPVSYTHLDVYKRQPHGWGGYP